MSIAIALRKEKDETIKIEQSQSMIGGHALIELLHSSFAARSHARLHRALRSHYAHDFEPEWLSVFLPSPLSLDIFHLHIISINLCDSRSDHGPCYHHVFISRTEVDKCQRKAWIGETQMQSKQHSHCTSKWLPNKGNQKGTSKPKYQSGCQIEVRMTWTTRSFFIFSPGHTWTSCSPPLAKYCRRQCLR